MHSLEVDVAIIGAGPIGSIACLVLAKKGMKVALIGPDAKEDGRTTALLYESCDLLKSIDAWDKTFESKSAPLSGMRLVDGSKRLVRAPEISFHSKEAGLDAFGYNIANKHLNTALAQTIESSTKKVALIKSTVESVVHDNDETMVRLKCSDGSNISAQICIAADGRNSFMRKQIGIKSKTTKLPQTALVMNLSHTRPHHNCSTEFHTETGPFTFVPMPGNNASLVWVVKPNEAEKLSSKSRTELSQIIFKKCDGFLGTMQITTEPKTYPLSVISVDEFAKSNTFLIGEACHAFPPIGAQGMNLGIRDIIDLANVITKDKTMHEKMNDYNKIRTLDIRLRTSAVDMLNQSLLSNFLPVHLAKGFGLYALKQSKTLRKLTMKHGLGTRAS